MNVSHLCDSFSCQELITDYQSRITASGELRCAVTAALRSQRNRHRALRAVFRRRRGWGFRLAGPAVHLMHDKEYGEGHDQKTDQGVQEDSVVESRRVVGLRVGQRFVGFAAQIDE